MVTSPIDGQGWVGVWGSSDAALCVCQYSQLLLAPVKSPPVLASALPSELALRCIFEIVCFPPTPSDTRHSRVNIGSWQAHPGMRDFLQMCGNKLNEVEPTTAGCSCVTKQDVTTEYVSANCQISLIKQRRQQWQKQFERNLSFIFLLMGTIRGFWRLRWAAVVFVFNLPTVVWQVKQTRNQEGEQSIHL